MENKKVRAKKTFGISITKGKEYNVIRMVGSNYIIIDDNEFEMGYGDDYLELVDDEQDKIIEFAKSLGIQGNLVLAQYLHHLEDELSRLKERLDKIKES